MATAPVNMITELRKRTKDIGSASVCPEHSAEYCEPRWYAAYTSANHERRVAEQLAIRKVEHFLPTYSSVRRWKDRRVILEIPLFAGYVFVRLALRDRLQVLKTPGVAKLVGFGTTPTALPQTEIDALRVGLTGGVKVEPHPYLNVGHRVRIKRGPLAGLEGILIRRKGCPRVVVALDLIQRAVSVEMDEADVHPLFR